MIRVLQGLNVLALAHLGIPQVVSKYLADPLERGVAMPVSEQTVARRIVEGHAIIALSDNEFAGCVFAVPLATVFGVRYFELSTLFVPRKFRLHRIAEDHLYPAVIRMVLAESGVLLGTTKFEFIVKFGLHRGMTPIESQSLPSEVRAALCTDVSCYKLGPEGSCLSERVWRSEDDGWIDGTHCCVRRLRV